MIISPDPLCGRSMMLARCAPNPTKRHVASQMDSEKQRDPHLEPAITLPIRSFFSRGESRMNCIYRMLVLGVLGMAPAQQAHAQVAPDSFAVIVAAVSAARVEVAPGAT